MSEQTLPYVTLAGDRSGHYRIAEERPEGTLVLRPDTSVDAIFNGSAPNRERSPTSKPITARSATPTAKANPPL